MLEPRTRCLLTDALRPPPGFQLERAIGTTFSLDLLALLIAPLSFAMFDLENPEEHLKKDSGESGAALLVALRRYADKLTVFCQAGRIAVHGKAPQLLAFLESTVFEVKAPRPNGVFHPKVWVLKFRDPDGKVIYRFLCSSRNLTFDSCWDTLLVLEGPLVERKNAIAINHPLGDFLEALPAMGTMRSLPAERLETIKQMADDISALISRHPSRSS